jgi:hypothetical protein
MGRNTTVRSRVEVVSRRNASKARARTARLAREADLIAQADRRRRLTRAGALAAAVVALAAVLVLVLVLVLVERGRHSEQVSAHAPPLRLASPPSLGALRSPPPAGGLGPEAVPIPPHAPDLAAAGMVHQPVDGIQCLRNEQLAFHIHAHLTIFDHGQARRVPSAVGIEHPQTTRTPGGRFVGGGSCFYWLHTHAADGIIHIESPVVRTFTLGSFFDVWGQRLGRDRVGPASGRVTAFYNGRVVKGNPRQIPLTAHAQIQLDVGRPLVAPMSITFPAGL